MKNSRIRFLTVAVLGVVPGFFGQRAHADVDLVNGDFSETTAISGQTYDSTAAGGQLGYNINATGWATSGYNFVIAPGTADGPGINSQYGDLQLWGSQNGGASTLTAPPEGGNFVAADGAYNVGALTQTVTGLTPGAQYAVTFYYAGAQQAGAGFTTTTTENWTVSLGSGPAQSTPTLNNAAESFTGWNQATFDFTADNSSDVLSFLAAGAPNGEPPFSLLGDVSLDAIPEASHTGLFMSFGVLAIAGARICRRKAIVPGK
jgi:hypothetical protein